MWLKHTCKTQDKLTNKITFIMKTRVERDEKKSLKTLNSNKLIFVTYVWCFSFITLIENCHFIFFCLFLFFLIIPTACDTVGMLCWCISPQGVSRRPSHAGCVVRAPSAAVSLVANEKQSISAEIEKSISIGLMAPAAQRIFKAAERFRSENHH